MHCLLPEMALGVFDKKIHFSHQVNDWVCTMRRSQTGASCSAVGVNVIWFCWKSVSSSFPGSASSGRILANKMYRASSNKKSPTDTCHLGKPSKEVLSVNTPSKRNNCQGGNTYSFKYPAISEAFIQSSSRMQKFENETLGLPMVASFHVG